MKSAQWRGQKQWKVANEKCWPAMKSSQWKGLACNKSTQWQLQQQWKAANEKRDLQWKAIEKHKASYEKIFIMKEPGIYMIYFL